MQDIYRPGPDSDPGSAAKEPHYGPRDIVLVMDTSFLVRLANRDLWANSVWHGIQDRATADGREFDFFMSREVIAEYEKMLQENRRDEYGIPLVHHSLETMLGWQLTKIQIPLDHSASQAAQKAWQTYASMRHPPESHKVRSGPSAGDLSVTAWARTIASQGAHVIVASTDFRDVINPLIHDRKNLVDEELRITPMPPAPLQTEFVENLYGYQGNNGHLSPMIGHALTADLQEVKLHLGAATYVIFEKDVKSGDAIFDVAVEVVELANPKQADRLSAGKFYAIPVIKLPYSHLNVNVGIMMRYFARSNSRLLYRLMVVDSGDAMFFPVLVSPARTKSSAYNWYRPFHTTSDFLYHQTDSAYARKNFRPHTRAARSGSH